MVTDSRPLTGYPFDTAAHLFEASALDSELCDPEHGRLTRYALALREQRRFRIDQLRELDAADQPDSHRLAEVRATLRHAAVTALAEIDAALDRLADGSYGTCTRCEQRILPERLEILPAAGLCMACQQALEVTPARRPAR